MSIERTLPKLAYTVDQLGQASGVGRTKIYQEVKAGRLHPTKLGKRSIILAEDAKAWLDSHRSNHSQCAA